MEFQISAAGQAGSGKRHRLYSLIFCKPAQSPPSYPPCLSLPHPARAKPNVVKGGLRQNFRQIGSDVQWGHPIQAPPQACYCVSKMNVLLPVCKLQSTDQGPDSPSESQVCLLGISIMEVCKGKGAGGGHSGKKIGYMINHQWIQLLILTEWLAQVSLLNSQPFLLLNWYWGA